MDVSQAQRVGEIADRPDHLKALPDDTHLITGTIEGHGATSLASPEAKLSARIVKLERTISGGIDYQVAILVSEPAKAPAAEVAQAVDVNFEAAIAYFTEKGFKADQAKEQVKRFGVARVLAMRDKELDEELEITVSAKGK